MVKICLNLMSKKISKCMIFLKHPKIINNFSITINNSTIEQVDHFNFLGVTLNQNTTWLIKLFIQIYCVNGLLRKLTKLLSTTYFDYYLQLAYSLSSNVWSSSMGLPKYAC